MDHLVHQGALLITMPLRSVNNTAFLWEVWEVFIVACDNGKTENLNFGTVARAQ